MKSKQDLIIYLIRQDLRQMQLLKLLKKTGFDIENFYLDILTPVAGLMGINHDNISDQLAYVYDSFMEEAEKYEVTGKGDNLHELAVNCYEMVKSCIEVEKRATDFRKS